MKHKRQNSTNKNGDEKSSKTSSCNSDLDEGKTNCSDSGFVPTSDKTSDNDSEASVITPILKKAKRKELKHDSCCVDNFIKTDRSSQVSSISATSIPVTSIPVSSIPVPELPLSSISVLSNSIQSKDTSKLFPNNVSNSGMLQNALSTCYTNNPSMILNTNTGPNQQKHLSSSYSPKQDSQTLLNPNGILMEVVQDRTLDHIEWGSSTVTTTNQTAVTSKDPFVSKSDTTKSLNNYYRLGENYISSPPPLSSSTNNIKQNNFGYSSAQSNICRVQSATETNFLNYSQIKSENRYVPVNRYPQSVNSKNNRGYNSFTNYCQNVPTFSSSSHSSNETPALTNEVKLSSYEYSSCDYSLSSKFANAVEENRANSLHEMEYGGGGFENGFNGQLSSPENFNAHYNTYPLDHHTKYQMNNNYSELNHLNGQHRIPSEYNAITLKQEQQIAGGCGYNIASLSSNSNFQYPYYMANNNNNGGHIPIASSPNSISSQTRIPMGANSFTKGVNSSYEPNYNSYSEESFATTNINNQFNEYPGPSGEVAHFYQLS